MYLDLVYPFCNLSVLMESFNPFTFELFTDKEGFTSVIVLFVFYMLYKFFGPHCLHFTFLCIVAFEVQCFMLSGSFESKV